LKPFIQLLGSLDDLISHDRAKLVSLTNCIADTIRPLVDELDEFLTTGALSARPGLVVQAFQ
jgi:hypothetical protein